MKQKAVLITAAAALLFTACRGADETENVTSAYDSPATVTGEATEYEPPFSEYMLELRGETENYMVVIRRGEHENEISVTVENNRYQSREFIITAPLGYDVYLPYSSSESESVVNLITNDIDSEPIPDILQFTFSLSEYGMQLASEQSEDMEVSEPAGSVSRMYTIDTWGELREVQIVTPGDPENGIPDTVHDYLDKTQLYHTEPDKFIYEISVDSSIFDEGGNVRPVESRVRIRTMTFDHENFRLVLGSERISEDNPLYFGYAYWAAANSAAQNFVMSTFNVSDFNDFVELPSADGTDYYFRIDDSRFSDTEDLMEYLTAVFSPATARRIFSDSPQKYTDIDGELYGIVGDGGYDYTLGTLTFSGMEISEDRMLFRSRQEKYDREGGFEGYTDGGDFLISRQEDGSWRVIQYRYPYS